MKYDLNKLKKKIENDSTLFAEDTFRFGKYQGFGVGEIAIYDPNYIVSLRTQVKFEESVLHSCQRFRYEDEYDQSGFTLRATGIVEAWCGPVQGDDTELYTFRE